jgi:glycosyltransferase involved in cell wall biosynthesis
MCDQPTKEDDASDRAAARSRGRPLRVLNLISRYCPIFSGAAMQQHHVLRRLGPQQVEATVLTPWAGGLPTHEDLDGVQVRRVRVGGIHRAGRLLFALRALFYVLRQGGSYDVIHAFAAGWTTLLVPLAARAVGVPCIYSSTLHGADDAAAVRAQALGRIKVALLRRYNAVLTYTPQQSSLFVRAGFAAARVHTVTCGVDDRFFTPAPSDDCRRELRREAGREDDGPLILFVGTLTARKGVDLLLDSFERLLPRHPSAVLVLMGPRSRAEDPTLDEGFVARLEARCRRGELRDHVVFLGRVESPARKRAILRAASALALFSRQEGLGIVILEAMACGVPAVLTPLPGVFDHVVRDGDDGRIVGSRDPVELGDALHDVLACEERRQAMGLRARRTVERRFSLATVAARYLDVCRSLLPSAPQG